MIGVLNQGSWLVQEMETRSSWKMNFMVRILFTQISEDLSGYRLIIIVILKMYRQKNIRDCDKGYYHSYVIEMHQCLAASALGGMDLGGWRVFDRLWLVMLFDLCKGVKVEGEKMRAVDQEFLEYFCSAYTRGKKTLKSRTVTNFSDFKFLGGDIGIFHLFCVLDWTFCECNSIVIMSYIWPWILFKLQTIDNLMKNMQLIHLNMDN